MRSRYLSPLVAFLLACGNDSTGLGGPLTFAVLDAGSGHTCAITTTEAAYCWGYNGSGELGTPSGEVCGTGMPASCSSRPLAVRGWLRFLQVSAGSSHTCGVTVDSLAYCWGANSTGELGTGAAGGFAPTPERVAGGLKFKWVDAGVEHSCGVTTTGAAYCWGRGSSGQLGDGSSADHAVSSPTPVLGGLAFLSIVAGGRQTCAIATNGAAYCWGEYTGNDTFPQSNTPRRVAGDRLYAGLSTQWLHVCGVTTSAEAYCWGASFTGQLGDSSFTGSVTPVRVRGGLNFSGSSAGSQHSCGVAVGGAGYCWGQTDFGQLGNGVSGATADEPGPVPVSGGLTFASITAGGLFSCGLTTDGVAYCWGENFSGALGDSTTVSKDVPVRVAGQ